MEATAALPLTSVGARSDVGTLNETIGVGPASARGLAVGTVERRQARCALKSDACYLLVENTNAVAKQKTASAMLAMFAPPRSI